MNAYVLFTSIWFVAAVTPGADTMLLLTKTLASGWRSAIPYSIGITLAKIAMLTVAYFGFTALLDSHPELMIALKAFGVAFLIARAIKLWRGGALSAGRSSEGFWPGLAMAFAIGASNPQAMLFYVAVVPQVATETNIWLLDAIVAVGFTLVTAIYAGMATPIRAALARGNNQRLVNRIVAVVFVILAAVIITR